MITPLVLGSSRRKRATAIKVKRKIETKSMIEDDIRVIEQLSVGSEQPQFRIGNDLVYIPRLRKAQKRYGEAFFLKLLTSAEWAYCKSGGEKRCLTRVAGRLAVKEAVAKALGCGLNGLGWGRGVDWREVEVISGNRMPPELKLHGKAVHQADALSIQAWHISLSHDGDYALATVLGLPSRSFL